MNNRTFNNLTRVFTSEIAGRPLFQSRAPRYAALTEQGLLRHVTLNLGGRFPVTVRGYRLSERGMFLYCEECSRRTTIASATRSRRDQHARAAPVRPRRDQLQGV